MLTVGAQDRTVGPAVGGQPALPYSSVGCTYYYMLNDRLNNIVLTVFLRLFKLIQRLWM